MPELPIIASTYRCAIDQQISGRVISNIIHVRNPVADPDLEDMGSEVGAAWLNNFGPYQANLVTYLGVDVTPLDGQSATARYTWPANVIGASTFDALPLNVAGCISWRTDRRGPSYRGRTYLGAITQEAVLSSTPAQFNTAWVADINAAAITFRAELLTAGHTLVVASYKLSTSREVTSQRVDSLVDTQRRRVR